VDGKKARNRQKERNNYEEIDRTFVVSAKDSCQSFFYIKKVKGTFHPTTGQEGPEGE
jgi:hypothetical protein